MPTIRFGIVPRIILYVMMFGVLIALLLPAVTNRAGDGGPRFAAKSNLKQIGMAMHNYLATNQSFPAQAIRDKNGKPLLSWRVALLPYFEQGNVDEYLYGQFHLDEPWNSVHNLRLVERMPDVYRNPRTPEAGRTIYLGAVGDKTIFGGKAGVTAQDISDGLSNTIMVVEADYSVPWTKPEDLDYDPEIPLNGLGHAHPGVFSALLSDGSVRFLLDSIKPDVLRGLMTINGGEQVTVP
jgi:hypothetical protein